MARKNYWGNYRRKHKISKGNILCIPSHEFDQFKHPGARLTGKRRCFSRQGLYKNNAGHWVVQESGRLYKQKKGKKGPYVHYSTL